MTVDGEEIQHLITLRDETRKRLRVLLVQKAQFGIDTPSHVLTEIRQALKDIQVLNAKLQTIDISPDVAEAVGTKDASVLLLDYRIKVLTERLDSALYQLLEKISEIASRLQHETGVRAEGHKSSVDRIELLERGFRKLKVSTDSFNRTMSRVYSLGILIFIALIGLIGALIWQGVVYGR